jgi:hypothetical protein
MQKYINLRTQKRLQTKEAQDLPHLMRLIIFEEILF